MLLLLLLKISKYWTQKLKFSWESKLKFKTKLALMIINSDPISFSSNVILNGNRIEKSSVKYSSLKCKIN
jgi:hypothetical protein